VGERFATRAAAAHARLPADGLQAVGELVAALAELERLGVRLQQVARMVAHEGLAPPEPIELRAACEQALAGCKGPIAASRLRVRLDGGPASAGLIAAAFGQVLELLIEHATVVGEELLMGVTAAGATGPARVRLDITRRRDAHPDRLSEPAREDELLPTLASALARGTGLLLHHVDIAQLSTYTLSVPMDTPDLASSEAEGLLPRTPMAAGGRVLIVDPRAGSRLKAYGLLHAAGVRVDAVENTAQAKAALQDGLPELLVSGIAVDDHDMAELIDELRAGRPALRVIELVDEHHAYSFSPPGGDPVGRLSRDELEAHLISAVSQEIFSSRLG
jgi:hypothetical protein